MRADKEVCSSEPNGQKAELQIHGAAEGRELVGGEGGFRLVAVSASGRVSGSAPSETATEPPPSRPQEGDTRTMLAKGGALN